MFARSFLKSLLVATFVTAAVPAVALADGAARTEERGDERAAHEKKFPMDAAKFKERSEKRLAKFRERLERGLEKHQATPEQKQKAMAMYEAGAKQIRAAVERVGKDGTVTHEEAREVRQLAHELKQKAKEARGEHAKGKDGKRKDGQGKRGKGRDRGTDA